MAKLLNMKKFLIAAILTALIFPFLTTSNAMSVSAHTSSIHDDSRSFTSEPAEDDCELILLDESNVSLVNVRDLVNRTFCYYTLTITLRRSNSVINYTPAASRFTNPRAPRNLSRPQIYSITDLTAIAPTSDAYHRAQTIEFNQIQALLDFFYNKW